MLGARETEQTSVSLPGSDCQREEVLTPIPETPAIKPTILTVEAAVNAKIFLETHYNSIYRYHDARSLRARRLDDLILERSLHHQRQSMKLRHAVEESDHLRRIRNAKSQQITHSAFRPLKHYEVLRILGKGSFGVVRLVKQRSDLVDQLVVRDEQAAASATHEPQPSRSRLTPLHEPRVFAMKVIRKSEMLRNSQEAHIRAERDMLVEAEGSRWIVPLIESFEDRKHLYLVMDFMIGGDFLALLIKEDRLEEQVAKFYIAEIILCLEESHRLGWIHRDVKPNNFLISGSGHLKISDFGLAFDGHWSHDQHYWHHQRYSLVEKLGITVIGDNLDRQDLEDAAPNAKPSECLFGETPFIRKDRQATKQNIITHRGDLHVSQGHHDRFHVSKVALNFINSLLKPKEGRIGCQEYRLNDCAPTTNPYADRLKGNAERQKPQFLYPDDAADIKAHPFFRDIDWDTLHQARPPMIPRVKHCSDTKYFDQEAPISEVDDKSTESDHDGCNGAQDIFKPVHEHVDVRAFLGTDATGSMIDLLPPLTRKRAKEKKRAKDRILRDETTTKDAMDSRKAGAFLGYAYRRPNYTLLSMCPPDHMGKPI